MSFKTILAHCDAGPEIGQWPTPSDLTVPVFISP